MLIKRKKLIGIAGGNQGSRIPQSEHGELSKSLQLEIQKSKQEAKLIKVEAEKILLEAQKKLQEAEEKVKTIISDANLAANAIKEKTYKETLDTATKEAEFLKAQVRTQLKELFEVKRKVINEANKEIIKIALELAEKIIRYKASVDPNILETQVIEAIKKATSEADRVQVYVNPIDLKILEEKIPYMEKLFPRGVQIISLTNESVDPGSCIVETKSGQLDARFSTQLQALTNLIFAVEVKEPNVEISEEITQFQPVEPPKLLDVELPKAVQNLQFEDLRDEDLKLTEEEESTISPFAQAAENDQEQSTTQEPDTKEAVLEIPTEAPESTTRRKLNINSMDNDMEDDEEPYFQVEDEDDEKKEEYKSILKPKKPQSSQISDIAQEIEKDPEWKDLVEEDEEEHI